MIVNPFKKYICIKQHDMKDCGAACIATVCKTHGLKIPISKIREVAGTDKNGTNAYGLIKALKNLGFTAKGVKGEIDDLNGEIPLPVIAHVVIDDMFLHYVVIHKINKEGLIVADPGKGIVKLTLEDFSKIWTGVLVLAVPTAEFKTGDETQGIFKRFIGLLKPQKGLIINIFFASIVCTILGIMGAFYFKALVDEVLRYKLEKTLHILSAGIILLRVFSILLGAFRSYLLLYLSQRIDIPLILGYYQHVIELPMNFFGTRKVGEIVSRFMDASKIRSAISGATLTIMIDTLMAIAGGIILYAQNTFLFGISVIMLILYAAIVYSFNKPIRDINREQMENNSQLTSYLVESFNGIETIKSFNAEEHAQLNTEKKFIILLKNVLKGGIIGNWQGSLTGTVSALGGVAILWIGSYKVIQGEMTVGQLLVFNSLLAYFMDPIKNLINLQPMMQTAIVASDRLGDILDLNQEKSIDEDKKITPKSLKGDIEFKNIDFRYGTRENVLKNKNISIKAGEKIALVGESGSGKTTLAKLLMRFYDTETGDVLINGYNVKDLNINCLRERVAYISQDIFMFSGTIKENLSLGYKDAGFDEIVETCKMASAHEFINKLPLRYNTLLEENAANLSGGQRQRLSIARALIRKPDILIMDEATSNLDSITEKAIEETIDDLEKTTIIIAHRLSTIMKCDTICVMSDGEIVERGNHHELMEQRGKYYSLWKKQLPNPEIESVRGEISV